MSDNENEINKSQAKDLERYKNAERIARALRTYLPNDDLAQTSRGRTKDKRICQLNAAFKYCSHLEKGLQEAYAKCGNVLGELSDDYKLLTNSLLQTSNNTNNNQNNKSIAENASAAATTVMNTTQQIHNSFIQNGSFTFRFTEALDDDTENFYMSPNMIRNHQNPVINTSFNKNNNKKFTEDFAQLRTIDNLRDFDHVDTSPILSFHLNNNTNENNVTINDSLDINNNKENINFKQPKNGKRRYVDENNNTVNYSKLLICTNDEIQTPGTSLAASTKRLLIDSSELKNNSSTDNINSPINNLQPKTTELSMQTPVASKICVGASDQNKKSKNGIVLSSNSTNNLAFSTPNPVNNEKLDDTTKSEPPNKSNDLSVVIDENNNNNTTTNANGEFKRTYFLRSSTQRLKNMLNAQTNGNTATQATTSTTRVTAKSRTRQTTTHPRH